MILSEQLEEFKVQIKGSGFPLEHWASSLLRKEGWIVTTNYYYLDSDDKKPREMDIVAFKLKHLDRFKVKTILLVSCKKAQSSVWGFLRRSFPEYGNQINLFPAMITSKYPPVNYALNDWGWRRRFCDFMAENGLSSWFGSPKYDVFAHQQIPLGKGKLYDSDMHSATMQLIKAQAYEMADRHQSDAREIKQFNLISLTEGDFVAFDFDDGGDVEAAEISEQVSLASYKIDECDHDSRIFYLTKTKFEEEVSRFTKLHELNVEFFTQKEDEFRSSAGIDHNKLVVHSREFNANMKSYIVDCARRFSDSPLAPMKLNINISIEDSCNPVVEVSSDSLEVLNAAHSPDVKERASRDIQFYWGYDGDVKIKALKIN
ncbi:hypothetical protein [Pseudomonas fluorescens]|uniref:Uncharacterized protein n=1 Tax=Pseudomonas fluorescens TaxID=294 RepID=A0A5E7H6F6_PSEFL|nr:hypothetical protein [Pseudomonas fluorescens]VVO59769.1 hypothetical protein PS847_00731 [Pseudomonas fluorescens]